MSISLSSTSQDDEDDVNGYDDDENSVIAMTGKTRLLGEASPSADRVSLFPGELRLIHYSVPFCLSRMSRPWNSPSHTVACHGSEQRLLRGGAIVACVCLQTYDV